MFERKDETLKPVRHIVSEAAEDGHRNVCMGVDHAGHYNVASGVDGFRRDIASRDRVRTGRGNMPVFDNNRAVRVNLF